MTLIAAAIITSFTTIEFFDYRRVNVDTSIVVDRSRGEKLTVNMNVTFPRVPCYCEYTFIPRSGAGAVFPGRTRRTLYLLCAADRIAHVLSVLSLDVMDISGETQSDITHNILKTRMDERGFPVPTTVITELQNDLDKINSQREGGYCGSCYGGVEPEGGCCNTCEDVRQAYVNRGWSFNRPDSIEQVTILALMHIQAIAHNQFQ